MLTIKKERLQVEEQAVAEVAVQELEELLILAPSHVKTYDITPEADPGGAWTGTIDKTDPRYVESYTNA